MGPRLRIAHRGCGRIVVLAMSQELRPEERALRMDFYAIATAKKYLLDREEGPIFCDDNAFIIAAAICLGAYYIARAIEQHE